MTNEWARSRNQDAKAFESKPGIGPGGERMIQSSMDERGMIHQKTCRNRQNFHCSLADSWRFRLCHQLLQRVVKLLVSHFSKLEHALAFEHENVGKRADASGQDDRSGNATEDSNGILFEPIENLCSHVIS